MVFTSCCSSSKLLGLLPENSLLFFREVLQTQDLRTVDAGTLGAPGFDQQVPGHDGATVRTGECDDLYYSATLDS